MIRPIYSEEPNDWKTLQYMVRKVFEDLSFNATTEKRIEIGRGAVKADVHAIKNSPIQDIQVVECKNWSNSISQNVVHSFKGTSKNCQISRTLFFFGFFLETSDS